MEPSRQAAPRARSVGNIALVSGIVTLLVVLIGFGLWYLFSPRQIEVRVPARGQQDGKVSATVVATKLGSTDTLFSKKIDATIAKETFFATVALPSDVQKSAYTLQLCLNDSTDDCASVASAPRSCSYYVAPSKSDKLATMFGRNTISYDNRLGCGESSKDFVAGRPVSDVKSTTNTGLAVTGDGIVVAKNGTLATMTSDELASKVGEKLTGLIPTTNSVSSPATNVYQTTNNTTNTTNTTALTQVTNNYTTVGADAQTLSLSGTVLSIAGGNSVDLSALQNGGTPVGYADATHDGMLRASDWQAFNAKQDVLTFDSSFVVAGTNVGLMSCAVGEVMKSSGTGWVCAQDIVGSAGSTYSAGPGLSLTGTTFANTGVLSVTASGALTSSGGQNPALALQTTSDFEQLAGALALSATGVTPGTYNSLTVDANGRVRAGTNVAYLTSESDGVVGNEVSGVVPNGGLLLAGAGTAADPYRVGMITSCTDNQLLKYTSANGWACANDNDTVTTNTDNQTLTWNPATNALSIAGGNSVDLSALRDNTDSQTLTVNGSGAARTVAISGGNTVALPDTDAQQLSLSGNTVSLTNGGSIDLSKYLDNTDAQTLTFDQATRTLTISGSGSSVVIPDTSTGGTVTQIDTGAGLVSGPITTSGTISLATSGATAGTYGSGLNVPILTVDQYGRVTSATTTPIPTANATTTGVLSGTDWQTFAGKENVLTFSDGLLRSGNAVSLMDCAASQILQRNGGDTAWVCANQVSDTNTTYSAGPGLSLTGTTFANTGVLSVTASGALTSSGGQNPALALQTTSDFEQLAGALALSATGVTPGTYNSLTVDANGRVRAGTNVAYLTSESDGVVGNEVSGVVPNGGLLLAGAGTAADPYRVGMITSCTDNQLLKYTTANGWACANDNDTVTTNTDNQTLTWDTTTNQLSIAGGNTVDLSSLKDNTDAQTLTLTNPSAGSHQLTISGGNTVSWTESQALSYNAATRTISLTNGGSITLPADANTTYSAGSGLTMTGTTLSVNCGTGSVAFCNGGNTIGAPATLGTNGANPLSFKTNNSVAVTLSATGELLVKDPSNSTVSFQVQDQSALPHLTIDTVNKQVLVGSSTSDATAISLVLDSYNNATDPTGVNGSMYYNSSLGKFRCYEGGAWKDCVSRGAQVLVDGYNTTGGSYPQAYANFVYNAMNINVGNAYNTTTGVFTAPEAGYYRIHGTVTVGMPVPNNSGNNYMTFGYKKSNGGNVENQLYGASASTNNTTGYYLSGAVNRLSYLQAGEQVSFIGSWSGPAAPNIYTALGASNIQITREYTVY